MLFWTVYQKKLNSEKRRWWWSFFSFLESPIAILVDDGQQSHSKTFRAGKLTIYHCYIWDIYSIPKPDEPFSRILLVLIV